MRGDNRIIQAVFLVGVAALFLSAWLSWKIHVRNARPSRGMSPNDWRLCQIAMCIALYGHDHAGRYPDTLTTLATSQGLPADRLAFVPDADDERASDSRWPYVYLGTGMTEQTTGPATVIAYAPLAWNDGLGTTVLFGDGHEEYVEAADLPARLAAGRPATRPSSGPAAAGILRP